jgi:hypothetical protein
MKIALTRYTLIPLLCVLLAACPSMMPQTFNQRVLFAYSTVDAVVQSTTTLARAGKISKPDAQNVHSQATNLKAGIELAEQVHATDPSGGEDKLSVTITALTALQSYLAAREQ